MVHQGSIFEFIMLICFGISWPITIIKTLRSKTVKGITPVFYILVFIGYLSGSVYKIWFHYNYVIYLYLFNLVTVFVQLVLYYYYHKRDLAEERAETED